jgi:hypothetical protein
MSALSRVTVSIYCITNFVYIPHLWGYLTLPTPRLISSTGCLVLFLWSLYCVFLNFNCIKFHYLLMKLKFIYKSQI